MTFLWKVRNLKYQPSRVQSELLQALILRKPTLHGEVEALMMKVMKLRTKMRFSGKEHMVFLQTCFKFGVEGWQWDPFVLFQLSYRYIFSPQVCGLDAHMGFGKNAVPCAKAVLCSWTGWQGEQIVFSISWWMWKWRRVREILYLYALAKEIFCAKLVLPVPQPRAEDPVEAEALGVSFQSKYFHICEFAFSRPYFSLVMFPILN